MPHWSIHITGDEFDLTELAECFTSPELSIIKEDAGYVLRSTKLDSIEKADQALERAKELVSLVNGAALLTIDAKQPLSVGNVARSFENGIENVTLVLEDVITMRDSLTVTTVL